MGSRVPTDFVRVSADGRRFEVNSCPWYFAGCNCYYLMTRAADTELRHEVMEVLDAAASCGLTAIRTWAFCEGDEWNSLQPKAGVFDERVFRGLDWVIAEAGKRGLRVMLTLVNYWAAYGGMTQYVKWSCERRGLPPADKCDPNLFYSDPLCQDVFHNFLATITARKNTETGRLYRDDPTIMCWGLANEARCTGDYSGSRLHDWAASTAEFMKSLDSNHLLTLGAEGFLGSSTPGLLPDNPYDCLNQGCDFFRNHSIPQFDFCTIHLWPDSWLQTSEEHKLNFSRRWINCHVDCCNDLGKPLVITEFGKKPAGPIRAAFYEKVFARIVELAARKNAIAGSLFWMTAARSYEDYDGTTTYLMPPTTPCNDAHNLTIVESIRKHAMDINALNSKLVYDEITTLARAERGVTGSFFWSAVGPAFLEPDSFSVRLQPIPQRQAQGLAAQISCLVEGSGAHASQVSAPQEGTLQHLCSHSNNVEAGAEYNDSAADEAILRVVVEHTSQMSSLNASWLPECPVM